MRHVRCSRAHQQSGLTELLRCVCGRTANRRADGWPHICITLYTQTDRQKDRVCVCECVCWGLQQRKHLRQKRPSSPTWDISHPFNQLFFQTFFSVWKYYILQINISPHCSKCFLRYKSKLKIQIGVLGDTFWRCECCHRWVGLACHAGTLTGLKKTTRMFPVASVTVNTHPIQFNPQQSPSLCWDVFVCPLRHHQGSSPYIFTY